MLHKWCNFLAKKNSQHSSKSGNSGFFYFFDFLLLISFKSGFVLDVHGVDFGFLNYLDVTSIKGVSMRTQTCYLCILLCLKVLFFLSGSI